VERPTPPLLVVAPLTIPLPFGRIIIINYVIVLTIIVSFEAKIPLVMET
jgi:hypothetical protein